MTTREAIVNAQLNCAIPWARQPIMILTPVAVIEDLEIASKWFYLFDPTHYQNTDTNDYVYLRLFPQQYSSETDKLGEGGLKVIFSRGDVATASTVRRGFKATIMQRERVILDVVQQLILISETSKYNRFTPIKVIDFCNLELGERLIYNGKLATVRYGEITIDSTIPALSYDQNYLSDNWSLTFKEAKLRIK